VEAAAPTSVTVATAPAGAAVWVDGRSMGTTPASLNVDPGTHTVEFRLDGYATHTFQIDAAGSPLDIPGVTLTPVETQPAAPPGPVMVFFAGRIGDLLRVDGVDQGKLPAKVSLTPGSHTFEVVGAAGDVTVTRDVELKPSGTTVLHLDR